MKPSAVLPFLERMGPILPSRKYSLIYADPPWRYANGTVPQAGVEAQYSTMSLEDLKALPVPAICAPDSVLFLWVTFPMLQEGLELMSAWGFRYKTLGFSWVKLNRDGSPFFGVGYYAKSNAEVCLLGLKGKAGGKTGPLPVVSNSVSSCLLTEKRAHSSKPPEVRDRIIKLFGDVPRIELFARERVPGWDCWGNEV